jgi:outer membrane protein assembly factor BamB|tara:strand:+ start:2845 stop:3024 length:180 start_codon:yes stop_codon:yes gene_type:complete
VVEGHDILWFGDAAGNAYVMDALSGTHIWRRDVRMGDPSMITGAPVLHDAILYIPREGA